jgi:large subunit ribosomal protein L22
MEITHRTHNLHIAPRKLRLVADQVRHMNAIKASGVLPLVINKGGHLIEKSLKSAIQVAKDNNLNPDTLTIQRIWCDEGIKLKRVIHRSRGRMAPIKKHYSHLSIVLKGEPATKAVRRGKAQPTPEVTEAPTEVQTEEK